MSATRTMASVQRKLRELYESPSYMKLATFKILKHATTIVWLIQMKRGLIKELDDKLYKFTSDFDESYFVDNSGVTNVFKYSLCQQGLDAKHIDVGAFKAVEHVLISKALALLREYQRSMNPSDDELVILDEIEIVLSLMVCGYDLSSEYINSILNGDDYSCTNIKTFVSNTILACDSSVPRETVDVYEITVLKDNISKLFEVGAANVSCGIFDSSVTKEERGNDYE